MCGRYVSPNQAAIERVWHLGRHNSNPFIRRFNVQPTSIVPMLRLDPESGELELVTGRWGLVPHWWKDAKPPQSCFNARIEEAAAKPMWRDAMRRARCLVPARRAGTNGSSACAREQPNPTNSHSSSTGAMRRCSRSPA